jgi:hypothetical protein
MTLEGARLLDKTLGFADIQLGSVEPFPATLTGAGWNILENVATPTYALRSYYDLSGYNQNELTSFFQAVDIQEVFTPFGTAACRVIDLVTTEYVSDTEIVAAYQYTTGDGDLPGFPKSSYDMQQVVYGRTRTFTSNSSFGDITLQGSTMWGTCAAATADKLHITRIVMVLNTAAIDQVVHVPACNYVTAIIVAKEDDLPFLMRQKRSYELATQG